MGKGDWKYFQYWHDKADAPVMRGADYCGRQLPSQVVWHEGALAVLAAVEEAFAHDRLTLAFQPIVGVGGALLYHECLLRADDASGAPLGPGQFVPVLGQLGRIGWLDSYVLDRVLGELEDAPHAVLGCNISGESISDPAWVGSAIDAIADRPAVARRLVLEFTETAAIFDLDATARHVSRLQALGVRVALDNFGSGFATLAYLRVIGVDIVKFDRSLVAAATRPAGLGRLMCLAEIARERSLVAVGEGVEDEERLAALRLAGILWFQGWHCGAPLPFLDLVAPPADAIGATRSNPTVRQVTGPGRQSQKGSGYAN